MELLLLTSELYPDPVLPALSLLPHTVRTAPAEASSLLEAGNADAVLVDARNDLSSGRGLCRLLSSGVVSGPTSRRITDRRVSNHRAMVASAPVATEATIMVVMTV